MNYTSGKS